MSRQCTDEFKAEAVMQVLERGFTVVDVSARIGVPKQTLHVSVKVASHRIAPDECFL